MKRKTTLTLAGTACVVALTGCASEEINPAIDRASAAVERAQQDPQVPQASADELERARDALQRARSIQEDSPNDEARFQHEAYLATRYAETAIARADAARAREEVDNAETERARVLLEARAQEARAAERQAQQRAAEARRAAELAEQRGEQAAQAEAAAREAESLAAQRTAEAQRATALASQRGEQLQQAEAEADRLQQQIAELEAERTERGLVLTLGDVLFATDRAELRPGALDSIDRLAEFLEEYPEREVIIEGHTDSRGTDEYNQTLSQQRADAVREALLARDIEMDRTLTRALGESQPIATNETAAGRQENRRVEIVISNENGDFESPEDQSSTAATR